VDNIFILKIQFQNRSVKAQTNSQQENKNIGDTAMSPNVIFT